MKNQWTRLLGAMAVALVIGVTSAKALADYPNKPINLVIGFSAGGGTDLSGRALGKELADILDVPVVVVNKPGAASMIAAKFVADAPADGYTLWYGSAGTMVLSQEMGRTELDFFRDFRLAGLTAQFVPAIAVSIDSPYQTVGDLIEAARSSPGELRWGHGGRGSVFHAAGIGFLAANGLDVPDVPFKGSANARNALFADQIAFATQSAGSLARFSTKMRLLAAIKQNREGVVDESVQTLGDLGVPLVEVSSPAGVLVPADAPDAVVATLEKAIGEAVQRASFKQTMAGIGIPVFAKNGADGQALLKQNQQNIRQILPQLTGEQ